ncbi:TlpA disulfide reductase family protein [Tenacibaculum tangerinum]|uniref:TlpA disulfide reductase family protein n=1 Tax=Tenacibaculum tangerinum TaxID=3038772 RepID=A0ABY8L2N6_9FLAO|nr:TlpA disulfide reductase family protein [Tenacibaculum tangerinum]WGH74912.1 TlpA disulfide reductase family protein [Tenacibaculum tangerinum]
MMKKLLALLIFTTSLVNAQYTVKGTMTPPDKGDWVILYKIEGAKQKFILNTTIELDTVVVGGQEQVLGKFSFKLPNTATPGAYRATYRNSGAGFIDFLFNKENVEFVFNPKYPEQSVLFTSSRENKVYREYLQAYNAVQRKVDSLQAAYIQTGSKDIKKEYRKEYKEVEEVQENYEKKSQGMLANNFIRASRRYNSYNPHDNIEDYLSATTDNFFEYIDLKSDELYNSSFLIDKVNDYVFYLSFAEDKGIQQKLMRKAIVNVMDKISSKRLRKAVIEYLITALTDKRNGPAVDWMFSEYYDKLPSEDQNADFKKEKLDVLLATVGRIAPDFSWKEDDLNYKLSTLDDGDKYLLVFWSTGCPHCTKEVPELYEFMQDHEEVSVVSFGIESDENKWAEFVKALPNWHHAVGTHPENKWENETVRKYNLLGTPTYFVLNKEKRIIAMPDHVEDVEKYFNQEE